MSASIVTLTFAYGLLHALTPINVLACALFGLATGYILGFTQRVSAIRVPASYAAARAVLSLVGLQAATVIGQMISTPANSLAYLGSHLAYIVLSIVYGMACGAGVWLHDFRQPPRTLTVLTERKRQRGY